MRNFFCLIYFLIVVFASNILAQDIHFSQFYMSPLSLSPAETGRIDASFRFSNNFRQQWNAIGTPFRSISVGFDKGFDIAQKSKIGAGIFVVNDKSGVGNLTVNKIFLSLSYIIKVKKYHEIAVGLQPGYVLKNFTLNELSFPNQFDPTSGVFNPNYQTQRQIAENFADKLNYFDLNAGVYYAYNKENIQPYIRYSAFHLNIPNESFQKNAETKIKILSLVNIGAFWRLKNNFELNPDILIRYNQKANAYIMGTLVNYYFPNNNILDRIFIGLHTRYSVGNFDALIIAAGASVFDFDIAISYDLNFSKLIKATQARGAIEVSLIYKFHRIKTNKITIPCDRY